MINSIGSGSSMMSATVRAPRPDPTKMAETLVANLDTAKKGYLEVSDLQTAFTQGSTANSTTAVQNAQQVFSAFDSNGDGQATTTEITTTLQALADRQQQGTGGAQTGVMQQGMGPGGAGGPPPPPPSATTGTSAASTVSNPADTNGDGTVSATEALAAIQSTLTATTTQTTAATTTSNTTTAASTATATAATTATSTTSSTTSATDALQRRIMQLMDAYGLQQNTQQTRTGASSTSQSGLSIMA